LAQGDAMHPSIKVLIVDDDEVFRRTTTPRGRSRLQLRRGRQPVVPTAGREQLGLSHRRHQLFGRAPGERGQEEKDVDDQGHSSELLVGQFGVGAGDALGGVSVRSGYWSKVSSPFVFSEPQALPVDPRWGPPMSPPLSPRRLRRRPHH
jgi:hypothetical protein